MKVKKEEKKEFLKSLGDDTDKKFILYYGFVSYRKKLVIKYL
jgi:hypothetical protein